MRQLPGGDLGGEAGHFAAFLRFYRATVKDKCRSLSAEQLTASVVPSGWSTLTLLFHLVAMERRWVVWGFLGERVASPYPDSSDYSDGPWVVPPGSSLEDVLALLADGARRTEEVLATTALEARGSAAGRFGIEAQRFEQIGGPPTLRWIGFHLLQEYARHAGQLDVAVELAGGHRGE